MSVACVYALSSIIYTNRCACSCLCFNGNPVTVFVAVMVGGFCYIGASVVCT